MIVSLLVNEPPHFWGGFFIIMKSIEYKNNPLGAIIFSRLIYVDLSH
jgi:hypothetical protein